MSDYEKEEYEALKEHFLLNGGLTDEEADALYDGRDA
jgi:hypothetical protein